MKPIVPNDSCLTQEQILRYIHDECQPSEMKAIDKHLTHCPMCSDAIEGAMLLDGEALESSFAHIKDLIKEETQNILTEKPTELTVIHKKPRRFLRSLLAIAASLTALVVAAIWLLTKPLEIQNETSVANQVPSQLKSEDSLYFAQKPVVIEQQPSVASADIPVPSNSKKIDLQNNEIGTSVAEGSSQVEKPIQGATATYQTPPSPMPSPSVAAALEKSNEEIARQYSKTSEVQDGMVYSNNAPVPASAKMSSENVMNDDKIALHAQESEPLKETTRAANTKMATPTPKKQAPKAEKDMKFFEQGVNYLQNKEYKNALSSFNTVITENKTNTNNDLYEKSLWYIATTYFMMNDKAKAKSYYQQIAKSKSPYASQAETILKNWQD